VWGDPKLASAEKGKELLSEINENIIRTIREFG
jgi:creatinine amidohydrolase/Fe(II)-dependent formamide hydrolase-like protein